MKIVRSFSFEIDGAKFTFEKPTVKDLLGFSKDGLTNIGLMFARLKKVEGIQDENGTEIGLDNFRELEIDQDLAIKIVNAWNKAVAELMGKAPEDQEKKESTPS